MAAPLPLEFEDQLNLPKYFTYEERNLDYNGRFSIRLTQREMQAVRLRITVGPRFYPSAPYSNLGYNPRKTMTCRYTAWSGSRGVVRDGRIEFEPTVIVDWRNEGAITRFYSAVMTKIMFQAMNAVQLAAVESYPAIGLAWAAAYVVSSQARNLELQNLLADEDCVATDVVFPQVQAEFLLPAFACPETLWKFVPDVEGQWHTVKIETWYLPNCAALAIAQPSAPGEETAADPDQEGNAPSPGGEPPDPDDESPRDPRSANDDYSTAPPLEPEEPPTEPVLSRVDYVIAYRDSPSGSNTTGCVFLAPPNPVLERIQNGPTPEYERIRIRGTGVDGQEYIVGIENATPTNVITGVSIVTVPC